MNQFTSPHPSITALASPAIAPQPIIAQSVRDPDVLGQMEDAARNFVESGQLWAFLIGFMAGYMIRSLLRG